MLDKTTTKELLKEKRITQRMVELLNDDDFIDELIAYNSDWIARILTRSRGNIQKIGIDILDYLRMEAEDQAERDINCEDEDLRI